jgi:hypothetical protein
MRRNHNPEVGHEVRRKPVAVRAVVVTPHPESVALQVTDGDGEGLGASFGQQPPGVGAAAGGQ